MDGEELHARLRILIGTRCRYNGCEWIIAEILSAEGKLVIESVQTDDDHIQRNLYGDPNRRCPHQQTLEISGSDGGYSEAVLTLLEGRIVQGN